MRGRRLQHGPVTKALSCSSCRQEAEEEEEEQEVKEEGTRMVDVEGKNKDEGGEK